MREKWPFLHIFRAYVAPPAAAGFTCATHFGSTDPTLLSQSGANAVLAACKTLAFK